MLTIRDFYLLPQVEALFEQLIQSGPGLIVVAGFDPRPGESALLSGRMALFRILFDALFTHCPTVRCNVVTVERGFLPAPRGTSQRYERALVETPLSYAQRVTDAILHHFDLLVLDRLDEETLPLALDAGRNGLRVLTQMDTLLQGASLARYLYDLAGGQLSGLAWILSTSRVATLCPSCKTALPASAGALVAPGCADCHYTGRLGDVGVLDIFRAEVPPPALFSLPSQLSAEDYMAELARRGLVPPEDACLVRETSLRRLTKLLEASERSIGQATAQSQLRGAELEAANRVLQHRTQALFSLGELSRALIGSDDLRELGEKVCQRARDLCGAERAVLYFQRSPGEVIVLAVVGWEAAAFPSRLETEQVFTPQMPLHPIAYNRLPPGLPLSAESQKGIRAGLAVPLVAQDRRMGMMVVHSTRKAQFNPGEVALLGTFANQAALALQRAGLVDQLQRQIAQLEAAQAELAKKERLEHEMELARELQQRMLPRLFPKFPGYAITACNQPARQVGGDFYDVVALDEGRFVVAIADVSDKGMPAALYMALTRSLLHSAARQSISPRAALQQVNRLLLELGDRRTFVTLFYGLVDAKAQQLTYVRAGHTRPILLRQGDVLELEGKGMPLGTFDDDWLTLSEEALALSAGDRLVLYTDGLTDVLSATNEFFGLERFKLLLSKGAALPPEAFCEFVFGELAAFRGEMEPFDDMAMMVLDVGE